MQSSQTCPFTNVNTTKWKSQPSCVSLCYKVCSPNSKVVLLSLYYCKGSCLHEWTHWDWLKCMVKDKYGNNTSLGWNESSLEDYDAVQPFRMDGYQLSTKINVLLYRSNRIDNIPQLEFSNPKGKERVS